MIKPLQALIKILQGRVILDDSTDVRIIKRGYPKDKTPCLTIDNSSGTALINKHIIDMDMIMPSSHPQYDAENPYKSISQQVIREERSINLDLNIWCDDEIQRDEITNKITKIFNQVQSDYYTFCQQYVNGMCKYLNEECKVDNTTIRGVKGQCPKPTEYNYQNIFKQYDIIRPSFDVTPPHISDDFSTNPPVLRSIMRISFSYYDYYNIGGAVIGNLIINEELL